MVATFSEITGEGDALALVGRIAATEGARLTGHDAVPERKHRKDLYLTKKHKNFVRSRVLDG